MSTTTIDQDIATLSKLRKEYAELREKLQQLPHADRVSGRGATIRLSMYHKALDVSAANVRVNSKKKQTRR